MSQAVAMSSSKDERRGGRFWAWVPAGLLLGLLGGQVLLLVLTRALDDPSFAVEGDYYDKALSWDEKMAQDEANARLGWQLALEMGPSGAAVPVSVRLGDGTGKPLSGAVVSVEAFHNARAARVIPAQLVERAGEPGKYGAELPLARPGLWELRFVATKGADRFTAVVRRDVTEGKAR